MELSVRPRAAAVARMMPVLRVWPIEGLLLHEEADPARVRRLIDALRRDGVLRNPPIVAPLGAAAGPRGADGSPAAGGPNDRAVALDGANRVTALRALGLAHAVVQLVAYADPAVGLSVWRHYVPEDPPGSLRRAAVAADVGIPAAVGDEEEAETRLAGDGAIAAIVDTGGAVLLRHDGGAAAAAQALCRLTAIYRDGRAMHRVDAGGLDDLRAGYGPGALVLFRRFEKSEILDLAAGGGHLPAGITRHLIPGRALRLNTPLAWLADGADLPAKQAALDAELRQRWQAHGVRYYAEPAFLFDE